MIWTCWIYLFGYFLAMFSSVKFPSLMKRLTMALICKFYYMKENSGSGLSLKNNTIMVLEHKEGTILIIKN
jgi:hypothetical protein